MSILHRLLAHAERDMPRAFARNVAWQYLSVVTVTACGFLYVFVVGRALGVTAFGLMSLGLGFASLMFGLVQIRLHETVIRFVTEHLEQAEPGKAVATVYLSLLVDAVTCLCAFAAILILAPVAQAHLIRDARGATVLAIAAATLLVTNIGSATAIGVLRACDQYKWHSVAAASGALAKLLGTVVVLKMFGGGVIEVLVVGAVAGLGTNAAIVAGAGLSLVRRVGGAWLHPHVRMLRPQLRAMAVFSGNNSLVSLSGSMLRDLDVNALGWFTSLEVVGTYRVAKSFASLLSQASDPVLFVLLPELSRFWVRQEHVQLKAFVRRITALGAAAGLGLYVTSFLAVPWMIPLVMGPRFRPAGTMFQAMAWWVLLGMPLMWAHSLACAAGRPGLSLRGAVAGNAVAFALYLVLIPQFGGMGAAIAYGGGMAITSLIAAALTWRSCLVPVLAVESAAVGADANRPA